MPLYDYKCRSCNKVTEVRHGFKETFEGSCPACGGEMARVFNPSGIVFKGSGFYVTDSRKSSQTAKSETAQSESAKGENAKSESTKTEGGKSEGAAPAAASMPAASKSDAA